jgi:hypothetical protein
MPTASDWRFLRVGKNSQLRMNVLSTSSPKGASRASLVYAGKKKVRYFLNTPRMVGLFFSAPTHSPLHNICIRFSSSSSQLEVLLDTQTWPSLYVFLLRWQCKECTMMMVMLIVSSNTSKKNSTVVKLRLEGDPAVHVTSCKLDSQGINSFQVIGFEFLQYFCSFCTWEE